MDGWDIFFLTLAVMASSVVVMKALFELRRHKIERVRESLMNLVHQGESVLTAEPLHPDSCRVWLSRATAVVRQRLVAAALVSFADATRDLTIGVEAGESHRSAPTSPTFADQTDALLREGMRKGVRWLHDRARFLRHSDLRRRLRWLRP